MKIKNDQRGVAHVAIVVLIVVVIGAVGLAGWKVWDNGKKKDQKTVTVSNTKVSPSPNTKAADIKYLMIKEWGVKFPLSSGILDASYVTDEFIANSKFLYTNALKDTGCTGGYVIKFKKDDFNSETKRTYLDEFPNAIVLGDNYYAYGINPINTECSQDKTIQNNVNKVAAEFENAVKSIQLEN